MVVIFQIDMTGIDGGHERVVVIGRLFGAIIDSFISMNQEGAVCIQTASSCFKGPTAFGSSVVRKNGGCLLNALWIHVTVGISLLAIFFALRRGSVIQSAIHSFKVD